MSEYAQARNEWTRTYEEAHMMGVRFKAIRIDWTADQIRTHTADLRAEIDARTEGETAFLHGVLECDNPYVESTSAWRGWNKGWADGRAEADPREY